MEEEEEEEEEARRRSESRILCLHPHLRFLTRNLVLLHSIRIPHFHFSLNI